MSLLWRVWLSSTTQIQILVAVILNVPCVFSPRAPEGQSPRSHWSVSTSEEVKAHMSYSEGPLYLLLKGHFPPGQAVWQGLTSSSLSKASFSLRCRSRANSHTCCQRAESWLIRGFFASDCERIGMGGGVGWLNDFPKRKNSHKIRKAGFVISQRETGIWIT